MEICAQYALAHLEIDPTRLQLWFGHDIAPGGYLWIFPKSSTTANVGTGISGEYSGTHSPFYYLDKFIQKHFPTSSITGMTSGGVPCSGGFTPFVTDGLMLVGDAAHQANPLSGGGIWTALKAAHIAGRVAAEAVQEKNVSQKRLMAYQKEWMRDMGRNHRRFYRLKEAVYTMTDESLNQTARKVSAIEYPKRTLVKAFQIALFDQPKLLLGIPRLFFQMG
jgi:digeranylgeranylglycerophospholipid reductase